MLILVSSLNHTKWQQNNFLEDLNYKKGKSEREDGKKEVLETGKLMEMSEKFLANL